MSSLATTQEIGGRLLCKHKRWEFFGEIIDGQDQDCMGIGMAAIVGS